MTAHKKRKREEAEERNARTPPERRRAFRKSIEAWVAQDKGEVTS